MKRARAEKMERMEEDVTWDGLVVAMMLCSFASPYAFLVLPEDGRTRDAIVAAVEPLRCPSPATAAMLWTPRRS